jgi:hypothetical protein
MRIQGLGYKSPVLNPLDSAKHIVVEPTISSVDHNVAALRFQHLHINSLKLDLEPYRYKHNERY